MTGKDPSDRSGVLMTVALSEMTGFGERQSPQAQKSGLSYRGPTNGRSLAVLGNRAKARL